MKDRIPIKPDCDDLFDKSLDGVLLICLLNELEKGLIDMKRVNTQPNIGIYKARGNINLALTAAKGRIRLTEIDYTTFFFEKQEQILEVLWELVVNHLHNKRTL